MKRHAASLCCLTLVVGAHADIIQLNTGKTLSGRVAGYADESFELQPLNAGTVKVPANTVASIDFSKGAVLATVELPDQKPLAGKIWLYARGALNLDNDKGETTRIPLSKVSRILFSTESLPERAAPPPHPKPAAPSVDSPATNAKIAVISHGEMVDIQKHCVPGKITVVDFYADWCGPCRKIGPMLEDRVNKDVDMVLRKINITNWSSPVSLQYAIHAVPHIEVYDRRGNKVGGFDGFNESTFESLLSRAR